MDRETLKNLLMTTSVVAIVAATGSEAQAGPSCDVNKFVSQAGFTQTAIANCIRISGITITGNVVIGPAATIGVGDGPFSGTAIRIHNSALTGSFINNGTILPDPSLNGTALTAFGLVVDGNSTITNGITNGAGTGFINILVSNTGAGAAQSGSGIGMHIHSSLFTGNVVNNGAINVDVLVDPPSLATANAHGMLITSTSFVGNVINNGPLTVHADAIAGAPATANSTAIAHADGLVVHAGTFSGNSVTGAGGNSTFISSLNFLGNVVNAGQILAHGSAFASAEGGAFADAQAAGIAVRGATFTGNVGNTGVGNVFATVGYTFNGNISNTGSIDVLANAVSSTAATSGTALATAIATAQGIALTGNDFSGNLINTGAGAATGTFLGALTGNITNTNSVFAGAEGFGTATSSTGNAQVDLTVSSQDILVRGVRVNGIVTNSGAGTLTADVTDIFTGNITNSGTLFNVFNIASGNASTGGTAGVASITSDLKADGISVVGSQVNANLTNAASGAITANLNSVFIGNILNSKTINVGGSAQGSASATGTSGTASVTEDVNVVGISVFGNGVSGSLSAGTGAIVTHFHDTFSGGIINTGRIFADATADAFNLSGSTSIADVTAHASGIRVIGATFAGTVVGNVTNTFDATFLGGITNMGAIFATATAADSVNLTGGTGTALANVNATANGIAYIGAVTNGNSVFGGASFLGNITNSGSIESFATAFATISGNSGSASTITATAQANGILVVAQSFSGTIANNHGTLAAFAIADSSVSGTSGETDAIATAIGMNLNAANATGVLSNSGRINATATSFSNDAVIAFATAIGMNINASTFSGNVTNSGGIFANAGAVGTALGSTAIATAGGIVIAGLEELVTGTVTNASGAAIFVGVAAIGTSNAIATGNGIFVSASRTFAGDVVNNGLIDVSVAATSFADATAHAAGILVGETTQNGIFVSSFAGNLSNSGLMIVGAAAMSTTDTAIATAGGIVVANTSSTRFLRGLSSFAGNISNTGTIGVTANAQTGSGNFAYALAAGVLVAASTATGNISNSGTIEVLSSAVSSTRTTAFADAAGIAILGSTGDTFFASDFTGNVTNTSTGMIVVQAIANVGGTSGDAHSHGAGILVSGGTGTQGILSFTGISRFSGNISNSGIISASATSAADSIASSAGIGIEALFSSFTGNVSNAGTIIALATSSASEGTVVATAGGIILAGHERFASTSANNFFASDFSGNISNSGTILASAIATGGTVGTANAFGIFLESSNFTGNVTNTSSGFISASAFANISGSTDAFARANAEGIEILADPYSGNVSNAGTIIATATALVGGTAGNQNARSFGTGIEISVSSSIVGNVTNTGVIIAGSTASDVPAGNERAFAGAEGAGIGVFASAMTGTIANTGGTIMAFASANAVSGANHAGASARMSGILVAVSTFIGDVTSSGVIESGVTANATGQNSTSIAEAYAGGIGVNFGLSGGVFQTSSFSGNITNTGTVMVTAKSTLSSLILPHGTSVADATGIRAFASRYTGNISNTGGQISATATATVVSGGEGFASARGILVGGVRGFNSFLEVSTFIGNVGNSGTIMAFASLHAIATTATPGFANADGIAVLSRDGMTGNVNNTALGAIYAGAQVTGVFGFAHGTGIVLEGGTFISNVTNDGTVSGWALADVNGVSGSTGVASAKGIAIFPSVFAGNVTNTGRVAASATAIASGFLQHGTAFATGIDIRPGTFLGSVSNGGTVTAFASAAAGSLFSATAVGVHAAGTFVGDITNTASGLISATAVAAFGGGEGVGIKLDGSTFHGNVSNAGRILATGSGVSAIGVSINPNTFVGMVTNMASGVISAESANGAIGLDIVTNSFLGGVNNAGLIQALGDATGIHSDAGTFTGAITNTGTVIGTGGTSDIGIKVTGSRIQGGITNFGTIQGGFASIDLDRETAGLPASNTDGTVINQSAGLLMGDVLLSAHGDTLNVFGGHIRGNISGNMSNAGGSGGFGNNDFVNFDMGAGNTFAYQYKITNINTVDLTSGMLVLLAQSTVTLGLGNTVTLGPGNIDPVNTFNQSGGSTLGLQVTANPHTPPGPNPPADTITVTSGYGTVSANTVNLSTGAHFLAIEGPDYYANTNVFPNIIVGLTSMVGATSVSGGYDPALIGSSSPLFNTTIVSTTPVATVFGTPNQDTLILTRRKFSNPLGVGLTPNEKDLGNELEGLYKTGNGAANALIPPIFALTGPQYAAALKSLDGETILERPDLWQTVMDSILHRLNQGDGFNGAGVQGAMLRHGPVQVASAGQSDFGGDQVAQIPSDSMGVVRPWSVWLRGYGAFGNAPGTINAPAYDETREGAIGGIDYHVSPNFLLGAAFNYSHGEVSFNNSVGKNTQDAYQFAGYGKWQPGPWYVDGIVGGGFTSNKETRLVGFSMFGPVFANGNYDGESFSAYAETGYEFRPGNTNLKLIPFAGVGYNYLHYNDFTETGAGPADLTVTNQTTNNLYSSLGMRAQAAINIGTRAPLVPELRVAWQHEFLNANQELNSAFAASPSAAFNIQGSKFSRESIIAGIGISNNVSPDMKVFVDYDAKIQGGYFANAVSAGLRWSFGGAGPLPPPASAPPAMPAAQPAMAPPAQAQVFVVYFDFDKSVLTPDAVSIIRQASEAYRKTGAVTIKIDGYTDLSGTAEYNLGLSKRRADSVRAELVKDGVPAGSVAEAWHGKDNPAVPTPNGVREPRNRRATIALP